MIWLDVDPNVVKPGWVPLLITVGIALVIVLLYRSMRHQFAKIDVSQSQPGTAVDPATEADPEVRADPEVKADPEQAGPGSPGL